MRDGQGAGNRFGLGIYASSRRTRPPLPARPARGERAVPPDPAADLELEDRFLAILGEKGGSLFQSEIVKTLGLSKPTVSGAVNRLHGAGRIEKLRKCRENLIRLN
ncbi:MAG TPA: MarR family transcriptional regulator [Methanomicrobiales archaeon]|nr:MarR family transcriptional regulator [Methanomicrobiales archaeon]